MVRGKIRRLKIIGDQTLSDLPCQVDPALSGNYEHGND